ncbi:MAG: hypothetical protein AMR96_04235 [Candidatus Adiutrix intracellularis]|nr:MAG: hypothetical protein AMR96_04235 [Candidatus Adiutrix intracellularis]
MWLEMSILIYIVYGRNAKYTLPHRGTKASTFSNQGGNTAYISNIVAYIFIFIFDGSGQIKKNFQRGITQFGADFDNFKSAWPLIRFSF